MEHTGSTAVEKPLVPEVSQQAEILDGVRDRNGAGAEGLREIYRQADGGNDSFDRQKDPLLSRWQFGLGRSAVFASDAKARWAADWITWKGYDKFWTNLSRDLLPHAQAGEASVEFDSANGDLVVDYRLGRDVPEPETIPGIFVFGPDGFQRPIVMKKIAAGVFAGACRSARSKDCSACVRWWNRERFRKRGSIVQKPSWRIMGPTRHC